MYLVIDSPFNRANYPDLIGNTYPNDKVPAYAQVKPVPKTPNQNHPNPLPEN
jgi:hypothetical protein